MPDLSRLSSKWREAADNLQAQILSQGSNIDLCSGVNMLRQCADDLDAVISRAVTCLDCGYMGRCAYEHDDGLPTKGCGGPYNRSQSKPTE